MTRHALPLNAIHAFLVTARHLNLTRAAEELCITQGAVSRKIASLESWLGFALFDRHARGLHLTARGAALLPELEAGYQQMQRAAEQASRPHATLRLRAPTCAMRWLVPKLLMLEKACPELHVALTTTVEHSARLEEFDAAILYGRDLPGQPLFAEELTPVLAPGLLPDSLLRPQPPLTPAVTRDPQPPGGQAAAEVAVLDGVTAGAFDALGSLTLLHPGSDQRDWQLWLQAQRLSLPGRRQQHFATMDLAIAAAIQGYGITVADLTLVAEDLAAGRLQAPFPLSVKTGAAYSLIGRPAGPAGRWLAALTDCLLA